MELCVAYSREMRHTLSLIKNSYYRFLYVACSKEHTFKSFYNTTNFTNKASRNYRIYVPQTFHSKILEIQHLDGISDHKLILLNLNLDKIKSLGNYYWKFNNTLLENNPFQQEVKNLINEYNIMKSLGTPHQNRSNFKTKIKKISKQ